MRKAQWQCGSFWCPCNPYSRMGKCEKNESFFKRVFFIVTMFILLYMSQCYIVHSSIEFSMILILFTSLSFLVAHGYRIVSTHPFNCSQVNSFLHYNFSFIITLLFSRADYEKASESKDYGYTIDVIYIFFRTLFILFFKSLLKLLYFRP